MNFHFVPVTWNVQSRSGIRKNNLFSKTTKITAKQLSMLLEFQQVQTLLRVSRSLPKCLKRLKKQIGNFSVCLCLSYATTNSSSKCFEYIKIVSRFYFIYLVKQKNNADGTKFESVSINSKRVKFKPRFRLIISLIPDSPCQI